MRLMCGLSICFGGIRNGEMASFFDAFVGKFSKEHRTDLSEFHNVSWEEDAHVNRCRACGTEFNLTIRKHHCRGCGGIYCETCAPNNQLLAGIDERVRACQGCRLGETPGESIRALAKQLEASDNEANPARPFPFNAPPVMLVDGSLYGDEEEATFRRADGLPAHPCGYFQLTNKTDSIFAVRVALSGGNIYRECSRPSYRAVLPHESIYGEYPSGCLGLDVLILHGNPNPTPRSGRIIYDPRGRGVTLEDIAPCARIDNFQEISLYTLQCRDKNAVLKYKGFGVLECRQGTKTKITKGFTSLFKGKEKEERDGEGTMDMNTNIKGEDVVIQYSTVNRK